VFCAIATPAADVVSMLLLAVPMVALYFLAVLVATIHDRAAARRANANATETEAAVPANEL
jgi:sec-independent protein translocase protein TatC